MDRFGRIDNLFDREYVGSVIVNESNGRYYEPAPGRNYGIGLNLARRASNNTPFSPPMPLAIGGRSFFLTVYSTAERTPANDPRLTLHPFVVI